MYIAAFLTYIIVLFFIIKFGHQSAVAKSEAALFSKFEKSEPGYSKEARLLMRDAGYRV